MVQFHFRATACERRVEWRQQEFKASLCIFILQIPALLLAVEELVVSDSRCFNYGRQVCRMMLARNVHVNSSSS
jgi:hypothetical protein